MTPWWAAAPARPVASDRVERMTVQDFDPADRFVAGTVGPAGQRAFYLQASTGPLVVTIGVEKQQVSILADRINDVLDQLATHNPALAEIVELKFFCGFSVAEIAAMRGVSERTVKRSWEKSRLYLHRAIGSAPPIE